MDATIADDVEAARLAVVSHLDMWIVMRGEMTFNQNGTVTPHGAPRVGIYANLGSMFDLQFRNQLFEYSNPNGTSVFAHGRFHPNAWPWLRFHEVRFDYRII